MGKKALITGITGQDGAYLTKLLIDKGYTIFGTTRDVENANLNNLEKLNLANQIKIIETDLISFKNLLKIFDKIEPDLVFHFACQSSVGMSFKSPYDSIRSGIIPTLNILECIRTVGSEIKLFLPVSSECFGNLDKNNPANELTPHNPLSPYAVAKSSSYSIAKNYRECYGLFISIGFMSNHESPLRGKYYVIPKLIRELKNCKNRPDALIRFGDLSVIRDWGWAPCYSEAMYKIITHKIPDDFIVATGKSYKLEYLVKRAFELYGIDPEKRFLQTVDEKRPNEIKSTYMNPMKAKKDLNWIHDIDLDNMLLKLINDKNF